MKSPHATALLTNCKRPDNLPIVIDSLRRQNVPIEIFLWDNSGKGDFGDLVDMQIVSSKNLKCMPRWVMACYASSDYVFTLDDDLSIVDEDLISKCVNRVGGSTTSLGKEGVITTPSGGYGDSTHVVANSSSSPAVDILKGRFLFTRKDNAVPAIQMASATVSKPRVEDDIMISAGLAGHKEIPSFMARAFRELPGQGLGEWLSPGHKGSRERAFNRYMR